MSQNDFFLDFDCPQFVDFVAGLGEQEDDFFESRKEDILSPASINQPTEERVSTKYKERTKGKTLTSKETQVCQDTSNYQVKKQLEKSPCVNTERPRTANLNRRRSRSESSIKTVVQPKVGFCLPNLRKLSFSSDNLKIKKKIKCPATPMCLKRPKKDKLIKSSEQMELEKIAELQKQLTARLRYNELSLKRLGLRKKVHPPKNDVPVKVPCFIKPADPPREVEPGRRVNASNNLKKIDEEIRAKFRRSRAVPFAVPRIVKENCIQKDMRDLSHHSSRNLSSISCSSKSDTENIEVSVPKGVLGVRNIGSHSGITFNGNYKKYTVVQPFTFDKVIEKPAESENENLNQLCIPNPQNNSSIRSIKENIPRRRTEMLHTIEKVNKF